MKENFDKALKIVLDFEGGYVNNSSDPGGATNYGITQQTYDHYQENIYDETPSLLRRITYITEYEVREIYYNNYWLPAACDRLPDKLDIFHFDMAVNTGVMAAGRTLQRAINSSEITGIKIDGIVGPKTLEVLSLAPMGLVLSHYVLYRRELYEILIKKNPDLERFRKGWMNRVDKLYQIIMEGK